MTALDERSLVGREPECDALDRLLAGARSGRGSVLVVRGESGAGKSALLEYVALRARDCTVMRATGVEAEVELPLAGLQQLLGAAILERSERLPAPQRNALQVAFGLQEGPVPDRFLVALAALGLLTQGADERPLVCLVDDAQWLDPTSVQVLSFVARRLAAERIAMVFAVREPSAMRELDGLAELAIKGLSAQHARLLLESVVVGSLDARVRDRIIAETRGNPLALLELPRSVTPAQLAGGFGLPAGDEIASQLEASFMRRLDALSDDSRLALAAVAADPTGDVGLVSNALRALGLSADELSAAEAEGLIEAGSEVRFRHPLIRSAAYRAASLPMRRRVHAALAEATDPEADPDRRAWHRAHTTAVADEQIAVELERSASRALTRGGLTAAAAFLERAASLTSDPSRRGIRGLAAAQAQFDAGAPETAEALLELTERSPLNGLQRAQVDRLRARIAFTRTRGSDTPIRLSAAARSLEPFDPELARETHLEALWASVRSGRFARSEDVLGAATAAVDDGSSRAVDLLLSGLTTRLGRGYRAAVPSLGRALDAFQAEGFRRENIGWCWLACQLAMDLWKDDACAAIADGLAEVARERGALTVLPFALNYSAAHRLFAGEFDVAEQLVVEAQAITAATSSVPIADFSVLLEAWRGDRGRTCELRDAAVAAASARGEGFAVEVGEWALATLHLGHGEYTDALAAAKRAYDHDGLGFNVWVLPELVEAAARAGDRPTAVLALERLAERSSLSTTPWARGIEARSRALVSQGPDADALYREAIDQLGRSRVLVHHARAHLIYGEWLRRERRRVEARVQLNVALDLLEKMGATAFAERARRELAATGEIVRRRTADTRDQLTAQEAQIARMASDGMTNPQIAAQLFLSHRTVEWHMRKVLGKLGITSRRELGKALGHAELVPS
jgi:DNA-binding CsgD family transcriptional regulator